MGECGETAGLQQNQDQRPRGSNLSKLQDQEARDSAICFEFNQDASVGEQITQPTSSRETCKNGDMDTTCSGSSNMDHPLSLNGSVCVGSTVTQPTSSGNSFMNGGIDLQCSDSAAGKFFSNLPELQAQHDSRIGLDLNQESCVGGPGTQHTSSGDGQENGDMDVPCSGSSNLDCMRTREIEHSDKAAGKKLLSLNPQQIPRDRFAFDDRNQHLLLPNLSWEEKVVFILHMVRCQEMTQYNPKKYRSLPTRFCQYNIAFFDLDKESDFKREPRFSKIPDTFQGLSTSINIISIKVAESDVPFPINIYGTVLARDQVDYRCVYLFKRGRDNPQRITSTDDTLTLTGPSRALAGEDIMFFEFNLKIKGEDAVDQDFSKDCMEINAVCATHMRPRTKSLGSCLSKVKMEFAHVFNALEASVEVNILNKKSCFYGKITAGDNKNGILLYDSKVAGTETKLGCGGSVSLTRRVVSVPWGRDLVLNFSVPRTKRKSISLEPYDEEWTLKLGTYELQVKIIWTGVLLKQCLNAVKKIGRALVVI